MKRHELDELLTTFWSLDPAPRDAAILALMRCGWHADGALRGRDLRGALLQHADLWGANFQGCDLCGADLSGALMVETRLQAVLLNDTRFHQARLINCDLSGATGLRPGQLAEAETLEGCILPDGFRLPCRIEMFDAPPAC